MRMVRLYRAAGPDDRARGPGISDQGSSVYWRERCDGSAVIMPKARAVSLHLARFDAMSANQGLVAPAPDGNLFCAIASDSRAAGTEPPAQQAFTFAMLGLHTDEDSARATVAARRTLAPWLDNAREVWSAVLRPFRHKGEVNWLDRDA